MPRFNVQYNDKYAVWSSIVDGFLTDWMTKDEWIEWRGNAYGENAKYDNDINWESVFHCFYWLVIRNDIKEANKFAEDMGFTMETKYEYDEDCEKNEYRLAKLFDKETGKELLKDCVYYSDGKIGIINARARIELD